ncbi:hypothetical protein J8M97_17965 [Gordonia polyisoprenivorans]|uniref:hypothetical protein n=1 Tax=Gordonia polyisoprenivorans TaxID=84595 RepID=UPI0009E214C0|nr:hypothetical protein [Gordonia polyisoprenivorans]QUD81647.1 hypothetical protein J8M97_17965 [Gordonia polyisoprenivorans]
MTEYFVQPGTRVPLGGDSTTPPDTSIPRGNPELGDGGVVQVIDAEWKRRAGVARNLAAELADARRSLTDVRRQNHYGRCKEGGEFHARVVEFIDTLTEEIKLKETGLLGLSDQCSLAQFELTGADSTAANDIAT